jgi:DNA-binding NarL/FixJ family response regulator
MKAFPEVLAATIQEECRNYRLTKRENEVINHAFSGKTDKEIAQALGNSPRTVQHQLESVYRKLGVRTRMEAIRRLLISRVPACPVE